MVSMVCANKAQMAVVFKNVDFPDALDPVSNTDRFS